MSVKRLPAVFVAALVLLGLAVPNEALCAAGLYSQEITLLQALKTVKELQEI